MRVTDSFDNAVTIIAKKAFDIWDGKSRSVGAWEGATINGQDVVVSLTIERYSDGDLSIERKIDLLDLDLKMREHELEKFKHEDPRICNDCGNASAKKHQCEDCWCADMERLP